MKTMTCQQLGGACDRKFSAKTFEEIAKMSQRHGQAMLEAQEPAHLEAMQKMSALMKDPVAMGQWMGEKRELFNRLEED